MSKEEVLLTIRNEPRSKIEVIKDPEGWTLDFEVQKTGVAFILRQWHMKDGGTSSVKQIRMTPEEFEKFMDLKMSKNGPVSDW